MLVLMDKFGEIEGNEVCRASVHYHETLYGWAGQTSVYGEIRWGKVKNWYLMWRKNPKMIS